MILQALYSYYQRNKDNFPQHGFENKAIPFLITIARNGDFLNLQDTRNVIGKKSIVRSFLVPQGYDRQGTNAWKKANLLWDHYGYVLGWPKSENASDIDMANKQHDSFVSRIDELWERYPQDEEIMAVHNFLHSNQAERVFQNARWDECKKKAGTNLTFILDGHTHLICQNQRVRSYIEDLLANHSGSDEGGAPSSDKDRQNSEVCLITGEIAPISRLHPPTPIRGSKSNAKIVAFQVKMGFDSYGKEQSYNAPASEKAVFGYATALKQLLASTSRQQLLIGDTTAVFWAERKNKMEGFFAEFFQKPAKGESSQDNEAVRALYAAPRTGTLPSEEALFPENVDFYVLGLAPNAARLAVRFWYAGSVAETARSIKQHFDDCRIIHHPKAPEHLSLFRLLVSTALLGKSANIPPNLAGELIRAILGNTLYPQTLLTAALRRIRAQRKVTYPQAALIKADKPSALRQAGKVTYPQAALIKAVLVRHHRYYKKTAKEVDMELDHSNTNIGYLLGRLFSVLEKIQEEANPGIKGINATIRDRFYGAASSTPVVAFPHLLKLKNHHLAKLKNRGRVINMEQLIGEIMAGISDLPAHLPLMEQGRFAVGYYHQRSDFFKAKKKTEHNNSASETA